MTTTVEDVRIGLTLTALDPIHHGAGTSGNTALLRTQTIVDPTTGRQASTPYVSGNSLRHAIRDALAWHLVRSLGVERGELTVGQVALLWSGGALSEPGAKIDVDRMRRVDELLPHLTTLGYSAGNDIVTSVLRVQHAHLVCSENRWRLPDHLRGHQHCGRPAGAFRGEEFGTRHDPAGGPTDRLLADSGMFGASRSGVPTQMIYDFQTIRAGAVLSTRLSTEAATEAQLDAIATGVTHAAPDGEMILGARRAVGFGRCAVAYAGPDVDVAAGVFTAERVERHTQRIVDNGRRIRDLLAELAG